MIRVLLVDDIADTRRALAQMLRYADGIDVVGEAADGLAALAGQQSVHADVVVMDIRMPRMDGIEATARLLTANIPHCFCLSIPSAPFLPHRNSPL